MIKKIKTIISLLSFIVNHPLNQKQKTKTIIRFFKWVLNTNFNPYPIVYPFTEKSKLIVQKGINASLGNLYCGLLEYQEMSFVLHFLRKDDFFIDIGANVGSYTILASAHVGVKTVSIEPVPATFTHLINNININGIHEKVNMLNIALGSEEGTVRFTKNMGAMNHVATDADTDFIVVPVSTLDNVLRDKNISGNWINPIVMKIDVEGFETEVLNGASETLLDNNLKAIIIELNDLCSRYGYEQSLIHKKLIDIGFAPYQYFPATRELIKKEDLGSNNVIYIRDIEFVETRVKTAEKVRLPNNTV